MTKYAQAAAGTQTAFFKAVMSVTVNLTQNNGLRQHHPELSLAGVLGVL